MMVKRSWGGGGQRSGRSRVYGAENLLGGKTSARPVGGVFYKNKFLVSLIKIARNVVAAA